MFIVNFSNIFVTSSHSSNSLQHFQCNKIFFSTRKGQNFEFVYTNFNCCISPNIIEDLLF